MKKIYSVIFLFFICFCAAAQIPFWGISTGSTAVGPNLDGGQAVFSGPNGNVVVAGRFTGTMDLNPGPGVYNITSTGASDAFVACYSSFGAFLWGFGLGGVDNDGAYRVVVDGANNVIITGFFQTSMDVDPSGAMSLLISAGGATTTYCGEGFVAKYSPTGVFQWAKSLGGVTVWDYTDGLAVDNANNIYVGGEYNTSMTISPTISFTSTTQGVGYLIKYDPVGNVVWGHAFGQLGGTGVTTAVRSIRVSNGFVYIGGSFRGTADFNPWGAPAVLTSTGGAGNTEGYFAKYDINGNFIFVRAITGPGVNDMVSSITLDAADNIYMNGVFDGASITFDPASAGTTTFAAPGGDLDMFIAKYNSNGVYQWGKVMGGTGFDMTRTGIDLSGNSIYVPGWFESTVDFDPGPAVANLTSSGMSDIFLARYDLNGNYICAFRVGTADVNDWGYEVGHNGLGEIYYTGSFGGAGTDFDPTGSTLALSSAGGSDVFLAKYDVCGSLITPTCDSIALDDTATACIGSNLTLTATLYGANPIQSITWTPAIGLSSTTILNPVLTTSTPGYYYINVRSLLVNNLVDNGEFTDGNTGFTSSYTYAPPPSGTLLEGDYSVYDNPNGVHSSFTVMGDHTTGVGNMMVINGGPTPVDVWCQTITVSPNTDYDFSAWFANCSSVTVGPDVPVLQFRINGTLIGTPATVTAAPGVWVNFATTWNSGPSTSANICIYDALTTAAGNDFVIDDISFREICSINDSVYIDIQVPDTTTTVRFDTTICANALPLTLTAPAGHDSYLWSIGTLSSAPISATVAGTYWVTANSACSVVSDTFKIHTNPNPVVNVGNDTAFCIGNTYTLTSVHPAGTTYLWSTGSTTDTIHVAVTGTYILTVTDLNGCTGTDGAIVTVSPYPVVNLGPDTVECQGRPILVSSSGIYTTPAYLWHDFSTGPTFTATMTGTYWLQVIDGGCTSADTINVEIKYDTSTLYTTDTAICKGKSVQVYASADAEMTIQWLPTAGMPVSTITTPFITPDTSAMYVMVASMTGCPDRRDSFYIDVQPNPVPFMGLNRQVCEFDSLKIHSSVSPGWYTHYTHSWSPTTFIDHPNLTSVVFRAGDTTNLVLTITTPAGCIGKDSIMVITHPGNFATATHDTDICPHDTVQLMAKGGVRYQWTPEIYLNDGALANPVANPITTQTYTVVATNEYGCRDTLSVALRVHPAAVVNIVDSVTIYPGESYQISPSTNGSRFEWTPAVGLNSKYVSNPVATPLISTKYIVHTITEDGCATADSINVYVDDNSLIKVPNAFTPGAGTNAKLYVVKRGLAKLDYFRIYNRWGNMVFESTDLDAGWDGTYNGIPQPLGVFVYTIQAQSRTGKTVSKAGNVTLLR